MSGVESGTHLLLRSQFNREEGQRLETLTNGEIAHRGDLVQWLTSNYLSDYLKDKPEYWRTELPGIIGSVLTGALSSSAVKSFEGFGSVPMALVDTHLGYGLPVKYWEYGPAFKHKAETLLGEGEEQYQTREFLESFSHSPDMDIMMIYQPGKNIFEVSRYVNDYFQQGNYIVTEPKPRSIYSPKIKSTYESMEAFDVELSEQFRLLVQVVVIPNTNIKMMQIGIYDRKGEQIEADGEIVNYGIDAFHFDFTELQTTLTSALMDARAGATADKENLCTSHYKLKDGTAIYEIPQRALDVMQRQDRLAIKFKRSSDGNIEELDELNESIFRMLRANLLHDYGFLYVTDKFGKPTETQIQVPQLLRSLYPRIESENLFHIREWIFELAVRGLGIKETALWMIHQELYISFCIDPYETIQFLRDSKIARLIPGFADLTYEEWNNILYSPELTVEEMETHYVPRADERENLEFLNRQQQLYKLGTTKTGEKYFDGLERVIRAYGRIKHVEVQDREAVMFRSMFLSSIRPEIRTIDQEEAQSRLNAAGRMIEYEGITMIAPKISNSELYRRLRKLERAFNQPGALLESIEASRVSLIKLAKQFKDPNEVAGKINQLVKLRAGAQKVDDNENQKALELWFKSLAFIHSLLKMYPNGITAKELSRLYFSKTITRRLKFTPMSDFRQLFYELKRMGVINRVDSLSHIMGSPKMVQEYSLRRNVNLYNLTDLSNTDPNLIQAYLITRKETGGTTALYALGYNQSEPRVQGIAKNNLTKLRNQLIQGLHLYTYEELQAMTEDDFRELIKIMSQKPNQRVIRMNPVNLAENAQFLIQMVNTYNSLRK